MHDRDENKTRHMLRSKAIGTPNSYVDADTLPRALSPEVTRLHRIWAWTGLATVCVMGLQAEKQPSLIEVSPKISGRYNISSQRWLFDMT